MSQMKMTDGPVDWECSQCKRELSPGKVNLDYMGSRFTVELMTCPACGFVYIPEDLAMGKMAEVELILEDK